MAAAVRYRTRRTYVSATTSADQPPTVQAHDRQSQNHPSDEFPSSTLHKQHGIVIIWAYTSDTWSSGRNSTTEIVNESYTV